MTSFSSAECTATGDPGKPSNFHTSISKRDSVLNAGRDGSDVTNLNLGAQFSRGLLLAMSEGKNLSL